MFHLAKKIGPRGPGTDGESAAASYILRSMSDLDVEVDMESFSCWKSEFTALIVLYGLAVAGFLLYRYSFVLSLVVTALVFVLFQMETYSWAVVSRLLPRSSASNVLCRVRPSASTRCRVVLAANYDTPRTSPFGRPLLSRLYRFLYILSFVCIILLTLLSIVGLGASLLKVENRIIEMIWLYSSPVPAFLLLMLVVFLLGEAGGRYTVGANDNASGVGIMLATMSRLAGDPLEHTDVWGVATARGFAGGRGMIALLKRHRRQLKDAYIINIDHAGSGQVKVITREGTMLGFRCSRKLKRLAFRAADRSEDLDIGKGKCRVKKSNAMVARVRGYRSISIGCVSGGTYPGFRSLDDTTEIIDRESLDDAIELIELMLTRVDAAGSRQERDAVEPGDDQSPTT